MKKVFTVLCCLCIATVTSLSASAAYVFDSSGYHLVGDANLDDAVDVRDLVRVKRHLAGVNVDICIKAVDCDGNGKIDANDLASAKKNLVGADNSFETGGEFWSDFY